MNTLRKGIIAAFRWSKSSYRTTKLLQCEKRHCLLVNLLYQRRHEDPVFAEQLRTVWRLGKPGIEELGVLVQIVTWDHWVTKMLRGGPESLETKAIIHYCLFMDGMRGTRGILAVGTLVAFGALCPGQGAAGSETIPVATSASTQAAAAVNVTVEAGAADQGWVFRDGQGREVTLRGFNVSGSTKLYETSLLPFLTTADAAASAQAMRDLTGANAIRFLISWEGVQPQPDQIDEDYLDRAAAQIQEFTDRGIYVLLDYHQDLYSSYLFDTDSWYTGDGAPAWVIEAGDYPDESCGVCLMWGQNMLTNSAVRSAAYDFWHNRTLTTTAGQVGVQDAFLTQAGAALTGLVERLPASSLDRMVGVDPFNEPFDGGLASLAGTKWEETYLLPFYQRFRAVMDDAGWADKPAFVEPLVFWNTGISEAGGLSTLPNLGTDYVFNAHYYDGMRMTINPGSASDGAYTSAMNEIRDRASALGTAAFVSEFGNALSGTSSSSRTPWMIRAMYQGLDSGLSGADFFTDAADAGAVLSATQWQWDIYSGRHSEAMNGDTDNIQTTGDAWNDEDHSVVAVDDSGAITLRLDARVLDRLYPSAVAGQRLAFAYEDLARSGYAGAGDEEAWLTVPSTLPALAALVAGRQYGILVWQEAADASGAPTELHLPASFSADSTVVVSDVATMIGPSNSDSSSSSSSGSGSESDTIAITSETGSTTAQRLLIDTTGSAAGSIHVALVANASDGETVNSADLAAAQTELVSWAAGISW